MAKYDSQLGELRNRLTQAKNILVVMPAQLTDDKLAAGLALVLSLQQAKKEVEVVTAGQILVSHSHLFGVNQVKNTLNQQAGNFVITLTNVVSADGSVPALDKLDWHPQGKDLNLVFHTLPGQKFEPGKVLPKYQNSNYNLIFVIGVSDLAELGSIYTNNPSMFTQMVNIDINPANLKYGKVNLVDSSATSISEVMIHVLISLNLPFEGDITSNLLSGIYAATNNLLVNITPDTFLAVSLAYKAKGAIPTINPNVQPLQPTLDVNAFIQPEVENTQVTGQVSEFEVPLVVNTQDSQSTEERPVGEFATSSSIESSLENAQPSPDWLTPKVFKGGGLG